MDLTNQKILVTGADGFIGSHLVEGLLDNGVDLFHSFDSPVKLLNFKELYLKSKGSSRSIYNNINMLALHKADFYEILLHEKKISCLVV